MTSTDSRTGIGAALAAMAVVAALACAAPPASIAAEGTSATEDPWISLNRGIFRFNDALDRYALEPVARGYDFVMPDRAQGWVTNFFNNLWFPVTFTNCVLQAKPEQATQSLARFIVNTTVGIGGFGDPATRLNVPAPLEDFGQTLGYWGTPTGPYLVLPLFGPSNVRDTFGRAADSATRVWPWYVNWWVSTPVGALEIVNMRARYLENVKDLRESSVDYYVSVRNAYLQRREALIADRIGGSDRSQGNTSQDDLYFPTDEEQSPQ